MGDIVRFSFYVIAKRVLLLLTSLQNLLIYGVRSTYVIFSMGWNSIPPPLQSGLQHRFVNPTSIQCCD
jgi:hypothetical protein